MNLIHIPSQQMLRRLTKRYVTTSIFDKINYNLLCGRWLMIETNCTSGVYLMFLQSHEPQGQKKIIFKKSIVAKPAEQPESTNKKDP